MRQISIFITTFLMSVSCFASLSATQSKLNSGLSAAWKSHQASQPQSTRNDITIVYGGEDVSSRPTLAFHSTTA